MNVEQNGLFARSQAETYSSGETVSLDLSFLKRYMRRMQAPTVSEIVFHFNANGGTVTGTTGGALAEDQYDLIRTLNITDRGGHLYQEVAGKTLRVIEQMERGSRQVDNSALALSSGSTSLTHDVFIRCIFDIDQQGKRSKDYRVPLLHFVEGGDVEVVFGAPANISFPAAYNMRAYFVLHDERVRELKSRLKWREFAITQVDDTYAINGSLRAAIITSDLGATAGYTSLAAQVSVNSEALMFPSALDTQLLIDKYRQNKISPASDDEFLASTPGALPLLTPDNEQNIGNMPLIDTLDVTDLASVPTSGRLVTCSVVDRPGSLSAEWLGFGSVADFVAAVRDRGQVKGARGKSHVKFWDPVLTRRLPIRVPNS